jgi:peptidyl-prolyl cis-trans isomerase SurA
MNELRLAGSQRAVVRSQAMPSSTFLFRLLPIALLVGCLAAACKSKSPSTPAEPTITADTWAVVDGHAITRDDVDKAYRRTQDDAQPLSDEEALTAKLTLLNDLIVQQLLLAKAAALKVDIPQNELDTAYGNAKKNLSDDAFQQELNKRKLTAADMREGLRRELLTQKVLDQEVGSKIAVSDKDVTDFFAANRAQFNVPEESYRIAQIVVTPIRDPQIANGTGDDATTPQAAVAKVRMLMERLKAGASFRDLAAGYSEDPESAPRGGDMGLVPLSKLKQVQPALRDAVLNKNPGSVNVVNAGGAYTIVLVVAHETAGQRDLTTPGVKDQITQALRGRREQLLRSAYLTAIRTDAKVVNYLARRVVDAKGAVTQVQQPPSLLK